MTTARRKRVTKFWATPIKEEFYERYRSTCAISGIGRNPCSSYRNATSQAEKTAKALLESTVKLA